MGDEGSFRRVALTTLVVTVIGFFALAARFPWVVSANFAYGALAGLLSLSALNWMVLKLTAAGRRSSRGSLWAAGVLHVGKYALIGVALYLLLRTGWVHVPALAAGLALPTAVLCLKEAGRRLNRVLGVAGSGSQAVEEGVGESRGVEG